MLQRLKQDTGAAMEPLPGFFARRKKTERPAEQVVASAPKGPALT
jgi:hypothetical protein